MCTSNSRGQTGLTDLSFLPTKQDEVSKKVGRASDVVLSRSTITLKDENGKTMGMIRGLQRADERTPKVMNRLWDYQKKTGVDTNSIGAGNIFFSGEQVYIIGNDQLTSFAINQYKRSVIKGGVSEKKFKQVFDREIRKVQTRNEQLRKAENAGAIILWTK